MPLPKTLLDSIQHGNSVLFLGAGASYGAIHPDARTIPSGQQLADLLATKFLDSSYSSQP